MEADTPRFGQWIPVTERLPDPRVSVLVFDPQSGVISVSEYWDKHEPESWFTDSYGCWSGATHWMPLPDPPKGTEP